MNVAGYTTYTVLLKASLLFHASPLVLLLLSFLMLPDSGVFISAGLIIYCTVLYCTIGHIRLSNYRNMDIGLFFFCYRTIGISNIGLANFRNYRTIGYLIEASIYQTIGYRIHKKLSVAHLCLYCRSLLCPSRDASAHPEMPLPIFK
jgi:hypothetical protein